MQNSSFGASLIATLRYGHFKFYISCFSYQWIGYLLKLSANRITTHVDSHGQ